MIYFTQTEDLLQNCEVLKLELLFYGTKNRRGIRSANQTELDLVLEASLLVVRLSIVSMVC